MSEFILTATDANFQDTVKNVTDKPVFVDFWAPWCGPCRMLSPVVDEVAEERTDVKVGKVNVDEEGELAMRYGVMNIPTVIFFKDGKEIAREVGALPPESFTRILDENL